MYAEDSFFTLTRPGQFGLALLSFAMAGAMIAVCWKLCFNRLVWMRLLTGDILFVCFVWLAPQIYYIYYIFLLEGLPWQIVVGWPPTPMELIRILTFQERVNLSFHAQGILGWMLVGTALARRRT